MHGAFIRRPEAKIVFFKFALVSASLETSRLRERYEVRTAIAHLLNPKIFAMQY